MYRGVAGGLAIVVEGDVALRDPQLREIEDRVLDIVEMLPLSLS